MINIYLIDEQNCFTGTDQTDPLHPMPGRCVFSPPPPTTGAEVAKWTAEGWQILAAAPQAPPAPIPQSVTMRQARLALLGAGLLSMVETAIGGAGPAAAIEWEYAQEVQRASGLVPAMATALGLTDAQIDALFVQAATL